MLALTRPFLTGLLGLFSIFLALPCWAGSSVTRTWEDLGAGDFVDYDKPSGAHFLEGAEVRESANVGACSGLRYLAKRALANALSDPGPLTLMFDGPRSAVSVCVGNPDGKVPREISLQGYSASDAGKPVAIARITLPPGTPFSQTLTVCRLLDHDLVRVELWYGGDALEIIDDLRVDAVDGSTYRISFEEHPAGTLVESQYAGVRFPSRPEIVTSKALGWARDRSRRPCGNASPGRPISIR